MDGRYEKPQEYLGISEYLQRSSCLTCLKLRHFSGFTNFAQEVVKYHVTDIHAGAGQFMNQRFDLRDDAKAFRFTENTQAS